MKPQETKTEFIRLRAEGQSYSKIADNLHISKSTCTAWERELKNRVDELKQEQLNELYNSYFMTREARIRRLGDTLNEINDTLDGVDFHEISPEKLLDYKLKYSAALKEEYTDTAPAYSFDEDIEPKHVVAALGNLLNRIQAGECGAEQASRESLVLANLLKAFDAAETKKRADEVNEMIGGRL